jgi:MarR family transcriptional regulator, organic hydroperoxide resistance regulator
MPLTVTRPELLSNGDDQLFRRALHDALGFSSRLQEIRNRLGEVIGLTGPAYSILIAIEHLSSEGEVGVSRVSDHLHLSGAFVTIEVIKLVKAGLVRKETDPEDGRRVILTVTELAHEKLAELSTTQQPVNDEIFNAFGSEDLESFARMMSSLVSGTKGALALLHLLAEQRRRQA